MLDLSDYKEPRQKSELQFTTALPQGQYRASQWLKTKQHSAQLLPGEELDHTSKISTLCVCVGGHPRDWLLSHLSWSTDRI